MPQPYSTPDVTVHDWGGPPDAPALVLLHGLTDSGECWADATHRWTARYRVLSWDARGHGSSPRFTPEQLERGVGETMAEDAVALLEALAGQGVSRPLLVGHSMGGGTAAVVAGIRPDLVRAVVLEDPALGSDPAETEGDRLRAGAERVTDAQLWEDDPAAAEAKGRAENPDWPETEYAAWARAKRQTDTTMLATGQARVMRTWLEVAAEIAVPALLLTCDDPLLWDDEGRAALVGIGNPHLRVERVAGADHCIRRSRPEPFHELVDPFLAEHSPGDPGEARRD
jgi:pimeloyl-ACP methyl ester carboxylesterase